MTNVSKCSSVSVSSYLSKAPTELLQLVQRQGPAITSKSLEHQLDRCVGCFSRVPGRPLSLAVIVPTGRRVQHPFALRNHPRAALTSRAFRRLQKSQFADRAKGHSLASARSRIAITPRVYSKEEEIACVAKQIFGGSCRPRDYPRLVVFR